MIPPTPPVDFSFGNVADQAFDSGPSYFPQAWDASQDMLWQEWSQYPAHSHPRGRSQSHPQPQYQQQCNVHCQNAPYSTANPLPSEAPRHHSLPVLQSSQVFPPSQPPPQEEPMLSPLLIDQLPHTFPYQDFITPPTPELPNSNFPSPASTAFYTPYSSIGELDAFSPPNHFPSLQVSPPASIHSISYSPYGSPYQPLPSPMASTTTLNTAYSSPFPYTPNHLPNNVYSPIVASPSSFHSMSLSNTPAMGHAPSLPPAPLPAFTSVTELPLSPANTKAPVPAPSSRREVPQKLGLVSTRSTSRAEIFNVGSKPGVRVRDVLRNKVEVDGHNDRVFESTGVRQFRFVIDWPGYESYGTYVRVQNKGGGFITRGELAKAVCQRIETFMRKAKRKTPSSPEDEGYAVAHGKDRQGITIDKLWLIRVVPKAASMWMAELEMQS